MRIISRTTRQKNIFSHLSLSQTEKSKKLFLHMMDDINDEPILEQMLHNSDEVLNNISLLGEELDKIGRELAEKPLPENFARYKKYIRLMVKGIVKNSITKEITARVGLTRTKLFKISQQIDQTLADLAQRILNDERNRIDILNLTDKLKGLILNILT
ncbi:Protein of unknown function [Brevinema andersonii]|uniref:DUF327 domain-containing protein n=1 Tax=Brevinema andersonii TaxID=34097 RepID=A0A1I1DUR3_BREAD|nr:DUF327 family protein [Brevinema andersonii]SFB78142.1 Protein of unknown function [Brevinema andersonii]